MEKYRRYPFTNSYTYFSFPVPINQIIFVPKLSYLIFCTDLYQYQEEICPIQEDLYICQNQLSQRTSDTTHNDKPDIIDIS